MSHFKTQENTQKLRSRFESLVLLPVFKVIPRELLSLFTADEFSLVIGGVSKIDVDDWKKNTKVIHCGFLLW